MPNPRLAERYAKSLVEIAVEKQSLEDVYQDLNLLAQTSDKNREFVTFLKSPVINMDKKEKIFKAIFDNKLNEITIRFVILLINKGREGFLPEIVDAAIRQYRKIKNIQEVKMTTAFSLGEDLTKAIIKKIKEEIPNQTIDLVTQVREQLIGGFILESNNNIYDASVSRQIQDIRKDFVS